MCAQIYGTWPHRKRWSAKINPLSSEAASETHYGEVTGNVSVAAHISWICVETRMCKETRTVYFLLFI